MYVPAYPGDSDAKRLARINIYERMRTLKRLSACSTGKGHALTLTGFEAAEIGCIQHYLDCTAKRAHFVDTDYRSLENKVKWPTANWAAEPVEKYLRTKDSVFQMIHLDYMGHPGPSQYRATELAGYKTIPGGFVVCAFMRGREKQTRLAEFMKTPLRDFRALPLIDSKRFNLYDSEFRGRLARSGNRFLLTSALRYDSGATPMGVLMYQHVPLERQLPEYTQARDSLTRVQTIRDDDNTRRELRVKALQLKSEGMSYAQIQKILHVSKGTVMAWLAHQTRGTYQEEE